MTILYITNGICGSGGLERVLSIKCSGFITHYAYDIHIISLYEDITQPFYEFNKNINFHFCGLQNTSGLSRLTHTKKIINELVNSINPDIISVCDDGLKGFFIPIFLKNKIIPIIYERHASINISNKSKKIGTISRLRHKTMQIMAKKFDKFIVLTKGNVKEWNSNKNIAVIPNMLPFNIKEKSTLTNKKIILVGSMGYNKGTDIILDIWSELYKKHTNWELHIYGKSNSSNNYKKVSKVNKLKNIYFHPPTKKIAEKYAESSISVLPSRSEGFGMVIIEAMHLGLPVVSFDCPHGPADIIHNNKDGFLIEMNNIKLFSEKLSSLMTNEKLRISMGKEAVKTAAHYQLENILEKWVTLFNNLKNN